MARPKLVSDNEVLDAARRVMLRSEPFTLSDVADEVGLSRAALIQRFENRAGLHLRVSQRGTDQLAEWLAAAPEGSGIAQAWSFLDNLVNAMGDGNRLPAQLLLLRDDVNDPDLNALARLRNRWIRDAIAARLPEDAPMPPAEMASLLQSVLQGAMLQWGIDRPGDQKRFIMSQLRRAFMALFPGQPVPG